jgi:putative endopeptidase
MKSIFALILPMLVAAPAASDNSSLPFSPSTFDRSVDVCEDPYGYVNNHWLKTAELPTDRPMWGPRYEVIGENQRMQRELIERAVAEVAKGEARGAQALVGTFYAAGMNEATIEAAGIGPIADDLARIDTIRSRKDVSRFIADLSAQGIDLVFDYYVWASGKDPDRNVIYLEQDGLGIADRDLYVSDDARAVSVRVEYLKYTQALLEESGLDSKEAERQATVAFRLERTLAKASLSRVELRDLDNIFHERGIGEIRTIAPHFDWKAFLAAQGHASAELASMAQPKFFKALDAELANADPSDWRAYLRVRLLDTMSPYLASRFEQRHFEFHEKTLRGIKAPTPRWRRVLQALTATPAESAMGKLFVEAYLPLEAKPQALAMVADLRAAFRARIERATWMSEDTRSAAIDKLDRMGAKIGYPDRWPDLSGLRFDPDDYAGNIRVAMRYANRRVNAKLGKPVDRGEWVSPAYEVNARYYPQTNEIVFPASMLLPPAFDPAQDPALNYAALGMIIGHEMTHGFDDQGSQFAADGALHDGWTGEDKQRFRALGERVAAHYSGYEIAPGKKVDGKLTLGENIADLGGLAIAYDALLQRIGKQPVSKIDGLTQQQRFFLRYASVWRNKTRPEFAELRLKTDPHAPDEFRAIAPIADMPEFSAAFGCKTGDAMHLGDKIGIW